MRLAGSRAPSIGNITSIGKFYIDSGHKNTPEVKIHFIIFKSEGPSGQPGYSGVTLELSLFVWGQNENEVRQQLYERTYKTTVELHRSKEGRNQFLDELSDTSLEDYWGLYRKLTYLIGDPERKHVHELSKEVAEQKEQLTFGYISPIALFKEIDSCESVIC